MINTAFRLLILVPAAALFAFMSAASFASDGTGVFPGLLSAVIAAFAFALIVWVLADHRKRARAKDDLNA
jgi:hypothetical protein